MTQINPNDLGLGLALSSGNLVVQTTTAIVPCVIGFAVDFTNKKIWAYNQFTGQWNSGPIGSQNPSTNTGGINLTTMMAAGAIFPTVSNFTTPEIVTANFGATSFTFPVPTGFSAWGSSTTWNPADKSANITLSNGNLTATSAAAGSWVSGRATTGGTTGQLYYEITVTQTDVATGGLILGLCLASMSTATFTGAVANSGGWQSGVGGQNYGSFSTFLGSYGSGATWRQARSTPFKSSGKYVYECTINAQASSGITIGWSNASETLGNFPGASGTNGASAQNGAQPIWYNGSTGVVGISGATGTFMVAIDFGNSKAWWYDPSTSKWNNGVIGSQNPATNTGGTTITALAGTALGPAVGMFASTAGTDKVTFNFGAVAFSNAIPSGFSSWDPLLIPNKPRRLSNDDTDEDQEASNAARIVRHRITGGPWSVNANTALSGVAGIGNVQIVSKTVSKTLTGVSATGQVGMVSATHSGSVTGVSATGHVGTVIGNPTKVIAGVSTSASVGGLGIQYHTAIVGVSAPGNVGILGIQRNHNIVGVSATGAVGQIRPQFPLNLQGVAATGHPNTPGDNGLTFYISGVLPGVSGTGAVGTLHATKSFAISGISTVGHVGALVAGTIQIDGVSTSGHVGSFVPLLLPQMVGVQGSGHAGTARAKIEKAITGVSATGHVGTITAVPGGIELASLVAVGHAGILTTQHNPSNAIFGVSSFGAVGRLTTRSDINRTYINVNGISATGQVGVIRPSLFASLSGVSASGNVGTVSVFKSATKGLEIDRLYCAVPPSVFEDFSIMLRWSDTKGETWNNAVEQSLGATGEYLTNIQFRRLGYARDRVFEISWSVPSNTALTGMFLEFVDAQS